jgi:acyl-CoA oxidase
MEINEFGELTHFLYGGARNYLRLKALWKRVEGDAAFDKAQRPYMNHSQRYVDSLRKVKRFQELCDELMPDDASWSLDRAYDVYLAIDENTPLDVHLSMFIPVLMHHTSAQQRARWLPRAQRFRMIGAYAQTELGHGSNVRALETTATFDKRYPLCALCAPFVHPLTRHSHKTQAGYVCDPLANPLLHQILARRTRSHMHTRHCVRSTTTGAHRPWRAPIHGPVAVHQNARKTTWGGLWGHRP